ncbi:hypothetical protein CSC60_0077 [Staphylococcus aureus]|nr:hypothetical protein SA957_0374 [Staphylococcus aureus subsp. aureus SA957]AGW35406.1 hypothetical protein SA40_0359 [Staphylococcus aureus subsp. aureus SA40]AWZ63698.1 hypothetical protein CSC60_0077 [Staphylococcus aureus]
MIFKIFDFIKKLQSVFIVAVYSKYTYAINVKNTVMTRFS